MITEFKPLRVGDVRKKADQMRTVWPHPTAKNATVISEWNEVKLFGWPILPSDLFNAEFRRPLI